MNQFQADKDYLGHKFEETLLTAFERALIPARRNPAPQDDYWGLASHDLELYPLSYDQRLIEAKL